MLSEPNEMIYLKQSIILLKNYHFFTTKIFILMFNELKMKIIHFKYVIVELYNFSETFLIHKAEGQTHWARIFLYNIIIYLNYYNKN